jgi:predicted lipoprotein with Yx(FWY)xxD motif
LLGISSAPEQPCGNKFELPEFSLLALTYEQPGREGDFAMISRTFAAVVTAALICTSSMAFAQMAPAKTADTSKGKALVDAKGMTLYTFDKDAGGKSMCNGPCADNWPPLMASADAKAMGDWTILARDDGKMMWAYKGKPLYTWKKDSAPGDTTGDGFNNGVWHMATP